ncbi:MAG TPA: hypothetical protein ENN53_00270 [Candidatus Acetothermia bacterium]|nr:hypothetical protein [Candidatus Acetothermia bacterium]
MRAQAKGAPSPPRADLTAPRDLPPAVRELVSAVGLVEQSFHEHRVLLERASTATLAKLG